MGVFTFYEYNQSGLIDCAHDVRLADLASARDYAGRLASRRAVEIWGGRQRLASIPPRPPVV